MKEGKVISHDHSSHELRGRTIRGISWSTLSQVITQISTFVISIVLARLLGPKAYGLIGMVTIFTGFAGLFSGLGFGAAIIQRKQLEPRHLDAAFWANTVSGSVMTLLTMALAPLVAWFYHEPRLTALTATVALKFVVDALNVVQSAQLSREMLFRRLAAIQISSSLTSGLLGLGMALGGLGVWSLVAQALGGSIVGLLLVWSLSDWRPRLSFEWKACKELFGFSASVLGFDMVNYWARTLDQLLIGRFLGAGALGVYSRAYSLMLLPLTQVSRVVGGVMFPAMSAIQDDKPRVKQAFLKAIAMIALITFPMMVGLFAIVDHFVLALLGTKWSAIIPILKLFCWAGLAQSVLSPVGYIYLSQGRTRLFLAVGLVTSTACAITFLIGIHWGIIGVAWSYLILNAIWTFPLFEIAARLINLSFVEAVRSLSGIFLCSVAMGTVVWGAGVLLPANMADWKFLAVQVPLGVVVYLALVAGFRLATWLEVRRLFHEVFARHIKWLAPLLR